MTLVLASASPRRRELLARLNVPFVVVPSRIAEREPRQEESPVEYAGALALEKARRISEEWPEHVVLAADTVVSVDSTILGKPSSPSHAGQMLRMLRGKRHAVVTAVAVRHGFEEKLRVDITEVRMSEYTDEVIDSYVASAEPMDKAGAYAIQGLGRNLVAGWSGELDTVIGLPLQLTRELLVACGLEVQDLRASAEHFPAT